MQRSGPTANRHFTGSRPQELSIHLGLFSRLLLPLDLLDGFQHLQTWGLFSSFHTTSHAQLPVRIWLTSKCIPKKPTGFISPRPDQNIQRKSLGIRRPCFFFPRSYPYQHFDLVLHLSQNARSKPVDSWWVSQIDESSPAVSPLLCRHGPSSSARTLSNFSLTTSCIASFISFLLEVMA